jgi:UDP-2,4-diacetamido-2,4,6-trideoxy-beta-L-altropyranose hydrolase
LTAAGKHKILFRADGNHETGLGHISRCVAIAGRINEKFDCYFATRNPSPELRSTISCVAKVIELKNFQSYQEEVHHLVTSLIPSYDINVITLDGYNFDTAYQNEIKENSHVVLVSIDDDQPFEYVSDVVINHANGVDPTTIRKKSTTKLYLGDEYLLLRKDFINYRSQKKEINGLNSLVICFGGSDLNDFTGKIIDCLKDELSITSITVIAGSLYQHIGRLQKTISGYEHIKIAQNLDAASISNLMYHSDLAIVPSSTVGLEAFASKMILVTGITASNQLNIYRGLIKEDTVYGVGDFHNLSCEKLLSILNDASAKFRQYVFKGSIKKDDPLIELYDSLV